MKLSIIFSLSILFFSLVFQSLLFPFIFKLTSDQKLLTEEKKLRIEKEIYFSNIAGDVYEKCLKENRNKDECVVEAKEKVRQLKE